MVNTVPPLTGWFATVRQVGFQLPRVLLSGRPTYSLDSVARISPGYLLARGIDHCLWDVDGTLTPCDSLDVPHHIGSALDRLFGHPLLRHLILSNCDEERFGRIAALFDPVPVVQLFQVQGRVVVRRRVGATEEWLGGMRVDGARPIRKPDPRVIGETLARMPGATRSRAVMIGDQVLTDIAAANLAGVRSIKVATVEPASFAGPVRLLQAVDRAVHHLAARHVC